MRQIPLTEAQETLSKYPTEQSYIDANYDADFDEGVWRDNSSQLSNYYRRCMAVVNPLEEE